MSEKPLEQMTLHDLLINIEHLARDLSDHLDLNFLPKLQAMDELIHPKDGQETRDITVRGKAAEVLASDVFTQTLLQKMHLTLNAVDNSLRRQAEPN